MERIYLPEEIIAVILDEPTSLYSTDLDIPLESKHHILFNGFVKGFRFIFYLNAALTAVAVLISYVMIRHKDLGVDFEERVAMRLAEKNVEEKLWSERVVDGAAESPLPTTELSKV